jgi:A/G-specific adenine glycosylase
MPAPTRLARRLLDWYAREKRDLPWRRDPDPYQVWVSEIMLQQTTVAAVVPYYERFVERYPDVVSLAVAREPDVLALWSGLGYYHRARNLLKAARVIRDRHDGRVPDDLEALRALPGVGEYTAGAILSIGHGIPAPALDGNLIRVGSRLSGERGAPGAAGTRRRLARFLMARMPPGSASSFTQALMDLGAGVCLPRAPRCPVCPVAAECEARRLGAAESIPVSTPRPIPVPVVLVALALERRAGRGTRELLLARRPASRLMGGMWDVPSIPPRPGESIRSAASRLARALDAARPAGIGASPRMVRHTITRHPITLHVFRAAMDGNRIGPVGGPGAGAGPRERGGPVTSPAGRAAPGERIATTPESCTAARWFPLAEVAAGSAAEAVTGGARKIARVLQAEAESGASAVIGRVSRAASRREQERRPRARPG